jgi:SAM-dependent methyltransferase
MISGTDDERSEQVDYIHDYQPSLNPLRARLALISAGVSPPRIDTACELGFGQGVSLNIHAAASSVQWFGTDNLSSHASRARELARASGSAITIYGEPFDGFADRHPELPDFDYIALHGVWSWIADRDRQAVVKFVKRKLKHGGVLYLDYYTLPGWASFLPLRQLLNSRAHSSDKSTGNYADRVRDAFDFVGRVLSLDPGLEQRLPLGVERYQQFRDRGPQYLQHELFSADWELTDFAAVRRQLSAAGLTFACSANFSDHTEVTSLTVAQRQLLAGLRDGDLRESVRDFFVSRRHRYEYWIKGEHPLSSESRDSLLRDERVVCVTSASDLPAKARTVLELNRSGEDEEVAYRPVMSTVSGRGSRSLGEIEDALRPQGISLRRILRAVQLLTDFCYLEMAQGSAAAARVRGACDRLNQHFLEEAARDAGSLVLASPVTGGGILLEGMERWFVRAIRKAKDKRAEWIEEAAMALAATFSQAEIERQSLIMEHERLPILRALQVV